MQLRTKVQGCIFLAAGLLGSAVMAQDAQETGAYQKRVLESAEIDFLSSYYRQDGDNAAVTGGLGTERLTDATATVVVAVPLNDNDVLTIDAGVSAYTSASSSNVNPFDGGSAPDPFTASSGASGNDLWSNAVIGYSHSSEDRNHILGAQLSVAAEYDYFSLGVGGSYSRLFNEKNTEVSLKVNAYFDRWNTIYPIELRPFEPGGPGLNDALFAGRTLSGNTAYDPAFAPFEAKNRNSYSVGLGFSQILSKKLQGSLGLDLVLQEGLLSTPFQRVYFQDVGDSFLDGFHLAEAIELLPDQRFKAALGGRLNYYVSAAVSLRSFYRIYRDDWGLVSHTASLEIPWKIAERFTLYPSYRYYTQTAADAFQPYNAHLSSDPYYTSDYDLSEYAASQYGLGLRYTDIFAGLRIFDFGLKSAVLKAYYYDRDTGLSSFLVTAGVNFVLER